MVDGATINEILIVVWILQVQIFQVLGNGEGGKMQNVMTLFKRDLIHPPLQKSKQIVTETYCPYLNGLWHNEDEHMHLNQQIQQICLHLSEDIKSSVCTKTKSLLQSEAHA